MSKKRKYKRCPQEFKDEAVKLITEQGYSVQRAAESLGVGTNLLYKWKEAAEMRDQKSLSDDEKSELKNLRKEVKELRLEREILKKAPAFFARKMK